MQSNLSGKGSGRRRQRLGCNGGTKIVFEDAGLQKPFSVCNFGISYAILLSPFSTNSAASRKRFKVSIAAASSILCIAKPA